MDFGGGSGVIVIGSSSLIDLTGSIVNTASTLLAVRGNSLVIVPSGFNPATAFLSYSNTAGITHTIGGSISLSGVLSGPGGLAKAGPGTLILSGSNHYIGGTTVNAGTLCVTSSNALADGTVLSVGAGGTFVFDPSMSFAPANSYLKLRKSQADALLKRLAGRQEMQWESSSRLQ